MNNKHTERFESNAATRVVRLEPHYESFKVGEICEDAAY